MSRTSRIVLLQVAKIQPSFPNKHENPLWSDLPLAMTLAEEHFNGGRLILRCVAEIGEIYREEAVLKLGSVRDPVPERGEHNRIIKVVPKVF